MQLVSRQHILDQFAADGITSRLFYQMVNAGIIDRRAPSRVHIGRAEAVWEELTPSRVDLVKHYINGMSLINARAAAPQRFTEALLEMHAAGKIDPAVNPVSAESRDNPLLSLADFRYLQSLSLDHLACLWPRYVKAESKGVPDPEAKTPLYARYTGHVVMSQLAATHPDYGTLVVAADGTALGARIYPARRDTSLPMSHENVVWQAEDPQPADRRKRGRRKGERLTEQQRREISLKMKHTRQAKAAEFRAKWAIDPVLQTQFPAETLPASLKPGFTPPPIPVKNIEESFEQTPAPSV